MYDCTVGDGCGGMVKGWLAGWGCQVDWLVVRGERGRVGRRWGGDKCVGVWRLCGVWVSSEGEGRRERKERGYSCRVLWTC